MTNRYPRRFPNRPASVRALAALLIVLLAAPVVLWERRVSATPLLPAEQPPPNVQPPQPFSVGEPASVGGDKLDTVRKALREVLVAPELPAEFRAAKVPGLLERLHGRGRSLFGSTSAEVMHPIPPSAAMPDFDFDGDGEADAVRWRSAATQFTVRASGSGTTTNFTLGTAAGRPAPADYDGDGTADRAVWRPSSGVWFVSTSGTGGDEHYGLGAAGDFAVPSAYVHQVGAGVSTSALAKARLAPRNATGGTDLYSQNFSWGTSLVGLPGRSGMDMNLGLSYNSLVWTKEGTTVHFDADAGNVSPGFRLGYPTIEPAHYDSATGLWNYLMVTPSGARVEFRQKGATSEYETADGSYALLTLKPGSQPSDPPEDVAFTVRTTDGTAMSYEWKGGAFRCKEVKDRNGNYITVSHDEAGALRTVTDTLGRVVTVNYDAELYPTSITQTWKNDNGSGSNTTHTWASFVTASSPWIRTSRAG